MVRRDSSDCLIKVGENVCRRHVADRQELFQDELRTAQFVLIKPPGGNQMTGKVWEANWLGFLKINISKVVQLVWMMPQKIH